MPKLIPTMPEIGREAIIVLAGAIVAAAVMSQFPTLKNWIKAQWAAD
jgi:hypothetical protein